MASYIYIMSTTITKWNEFNDNYHYHTKLDIGHLLMEYIHVMTHDKSRKYNHEFLLPNTKPH